MANRLPKIQQPNDKAEACKAGGPKFTPIQTKCFMNVSRRMEGGKNEPNTNNGLVFAVPDYW